MQALILAGGKGTRLEPLTINTPKSVIPLGNKTILETQLRLLKAAGIKDIILSLSYEPSIIKKMLGSGSDLGVRLNYLVEPEPRGTAGAYKFAEKFIDSTTIILNGDILTDLDLQSVINQHRSLNSSATIVLTEVENPKAYGLVELDENKNVLEFLEKPETNYKEKSEIKTINAGIYILEPHILNYIPEDENCSFEYYLFPDLLRRKESFCAYVAQDAYWLDIGTPKRYLLAHQDLINSKVKNFQINRNRNFEARKGAEIDSLSIIEDGCIISCGAKIIKSVLGKNVFIGENTIIKNSVIWSGTKIDSQSYISNSILGNNCRIGKNISLSEHTILSSNTVLF
ncbi:MAG: sugar phosphate nucleotidyltransferase [Pyrinomonadaceae bacterium]